MRNAALAIVAKAALRSDGKDSSVVPVAYKLFISRICHQKAGPTFRSPPQN